MQTVAVVTTIQPPTNCIQRLGDVLIKENIPLLAMGDKKGPASFDQQGSEFFSLEMQCKFSSSFRLPSLLPTGHYCRKNVGYLIAMHRGAKRIFETDDDNAPMDNWILREESIDAATVNASTCSGVSWCNIYRLFSDSQLIWPRGLPLDHVRDDLPCVNEDKQQQQCPIQQGLADGAPDVDAIWRLLIDRDFRFDKREPVVLGPGMWCPFNSQNTWWFTRAFPLMYLPSFCSFRMTDIWRSFVAQRCLWELGTGVEFHSADVVQDRNPHNLMRDFTDEIPGYTRNSELCAVLLALQLEKGEHTVAENMKSCYKALVAGGFFPEKELELVEAWLHDVAAATQANRSQ